VVSEPIVINAVLKELGRKNLNWIYGRSSNTSVSLIGGLGEQGGDLSLPGIGLCRSATEGRSCLFSVFFWIDAAFLSALALASAFFLLGFPASLPFWPGILHLGLPVSQRTIGN
jgi:hypothetical protein